MSIVVKEIKAGYYIKMVYLIGLASIIFSFLQKVPFAIKLLSEMVKKPNFTDPALALLLISVALMVLIFLGSRFINIARGKINLNTFVYDNKSVYLRTFAIVLLSLGIVATALVYSNLLILRGGGQVFIHSDYLYLANSLSFAIPLGIVLFELSRLRGFEKNIDNNT